ncbi:GIY-YIG nuclease family protein [Micromonospora sediminicola]|uniref:GIY-YIG nuclease family protein n=1 Tax=Micromonospora sediminicola TaxID=946078 RepID=UPI0037B031C1
MPRRVSAASLAINNQPHALYRFFDRTDALLYVGITMNLPARLKQHRKDKHWWLQVTNIVIEPFETREAALAAEKKAIRDESPVYNDQHNEHVWVEHSTRPEDIDSDWIERNWQKVHPYVRDHVEVPSWERGRRDLAETILDFYGPAEHRQFEQAARESAEDDGEDEPAGAELIAMSAIEAFKQAFYDRDRLRYALDSLLRSLFSTDFNSRMTEAAEEIHAKAGEDPSEVGSLSWLAILASADLDAASFDLLPEKERQRWYAAAVSLDVHWGGAGDLRSVAGRYARRFRQEGDLPADLCKAADDGGICTNRAAQWVKLLNCHSCFPWRSEDCAGHRIWCDRHLAEVIFSGAHQVAGSPYVVASIAPSNNRRGGGF